MAYISGERGQAMLFPPSIEEYIASDDPVRVYDAFVDQLDLAALGIHLNAQQVGAPEYDPRAMLKLLVYGYAYGIRSSRKLERAVHHNLSFIWLVGGLKPDHKTIARFRRDHREALKAVLKHGVRVCLKLNLISGNTLFVDGTRLAANASLRHGWTRKQWEGLLRETDRRIEAILVESEATDLAEGEQESLVHLPADVNAARAIRRRVQTALAAFDEHPRKVVNRTDPDCRHLKSRRGSMAGYHVQAVVDDQHGLLVHTEVVNDANDRGQFLPQIAQAQEVLGKPCAVACGDAGYANTAALKVLEEQGIMVIVPSQDQARRQPVPPPFGPQEFRYDPATDSYTCPAGHPLRYRKTDGKTRKRTYQIICASLCHCCPHFGACTTARHGRAVVKLLDAEVKERLEAQYQSPMGQEIYRRRKQRAEHPFGHIKHNLGVRSFLLRGLAGVRAEAGLLATAFNLTRMITIVGVSGLLAQWRPA